MTHGFAAMSSWNQKHIPIPPWCSEAYNVQQIHKGKMLNARCAAHNAIETLNRSLLWSEMWLLRQICYKLNNQLRREKCIDRVKQISKCLKKLQEMELDKRLAKLVEMIPSRLSLTMETVYLPSKKVVKYILMCLLGAVALLKQTVNYSTSSYILVTQQLSLGLFARQMTVMAATVSRVWVLCRSLIEQLCESYKSLYLWLHELNLSLPSPMSEDLSDTIPSDIRAYLSLSCEESTQSNAVSLLEQQQDSVAWKLKAVENCGETIDRDWFNSRVALEAGVSDIRQKSPVIKKVRKFLSPEIITPQSSPELKLARSRLSKSEMHECMLSVQSCCNISQIYLLMAKLSRSHPGVSFRGMKLCLARLKKLISAKNLDKDRQNRIGDNKRLLLRGQQAVHKFLAKNQSDESTEAREKVKRKKNKLEKKKLTTDATKQSVTLASDVTIEKKRNKKKLAMEKLTSDATKQSVTLAGDMTIEKKRKKKKLAMEKLTSDATKQSVTLAGDMTIEKKRKKKKLAMEKLTSDATKQCVTLVSDMTIEKKRRKKKRAMKKLASDATKQSVTLASDITIEKK